MSKDTYTVSASRDERPGNPEMPITSMAGWPYLRGQCAALGIFNRYGSGKILTIVDFFVKDVSTPNAATAVSNFLVQKVSAWTIGNTNAEKTVADGYVHKFDTNNSDLPSQVKFYEDVESVTLAGGGYIRRIRQMPFFNATRALSDLVFMGHADKDSGFNTASIFRRFNVGGDVQPMIVREGEGICINMENSYVYLTMKYWLNIFIRDTSNGQCYGVNCAITPDGGRVPFLFVNESGSGKTYQVFNIEMAEIGDDAQINLYSIEKIETLDYNTGGSADVVYHDSANGSLTNKIECRRDCNVTTFGESQGVMMARPLMIRDWQTNMGGAPYLSGTMSLNLGSRNPNFLNLRNVNSEIRLREGEGVAMFKRTVSGIGKALITVRFTVENATEAPAGGNTYSRSRLVNA